MDRRGALVSSIRVAGATAAAAAGMAAVLVACGGGGGASYTLPDSGNSVTGEAQSAGQTCNAGDATQGGQACADRWQLVSEQAAFVGRDGAGALVYQNKMWLLGGWNPNGVFPNGPTTNEVWNSADGIHWLLVKPDTATSWEPRHMAGWVVFDNKMWILGGDDELGHYQYDVWNSSDGVNWTQVTANAPWANQAPAGQPPDGRVLHYVLAFNNQLWVLGGQSLPQLLTPAPQPAPATTFYSDVWSSPDGVNWTQVTDNAPWADPGRGMICGAVVFNGRMWVIGGGNYWAADPPVPGTGHNDVWYSSDGANWTEATANAPWQARRYHNVAVFQNRIWVLAGVTNDQDDQAPLNDVWSSADGITWIQANGSGGPIPWAPRHAASVFVFGGALWLTAGTQVGQLNDVWKLD